MHAQEGAQVFRGSTREKGEHGYATRCEGATVNMGRSVFGWSELERPDREVRWWYRREREI